MNPRVLFRRDVPDDLHSLVAYIDQFNPSAAERFLSALFPALDELAEMPGKGSPKYFRDKRLEGIRSWSISGFRNFLILYRPMPDGIDVVAIVHGARDIRALFLRRE